MSLTKKRKSDAHIDQAGVVNAKKEKWYTEEQKVKMLSTPLEPTQNTSRRSSFMGALKRMVSGSTMKDKTRSSAKMPAAQLPSASNTFKENDTSFASETSQESEPHLPADKLVNNYGLRQFVQTGEAPVEKADISLETSCSDPFDTTISSGSIYSVVTPCRAIRRDNSRRPSVRSMPESTTLVEGLALTSVRRHASVSSEHNISSPVSRHSRMSFRFFKNRHSTSMADLPENRELNTSFAPLAEADETQDINAITPQPVKKESNLVRTASRLFGSGKKRTTIATPNEILGISTNTAGGEEIFSTPTNSSILTNTSPSSGLQKRVSSAFNMLRFKTTPSPGRNNRVQRSKTENPKKDHRIRKRTEVNPRRSTLATGGLHNTSLIETINEQAMLKEKAEAERFRKQVRIAEEPIPEILNKMDFDAILVDIIDGRPASVPANAVLTHYGVAEEVRIACLEDVDKMQIICKKDGTPTFVCIKMESSSLKPLDARVRIGVGSGLREVWNQVGVKRVLAYPMFCFNESEWNDTEKCIEQFFTMVLHALDWNSSPDNIDYVVLAGVTPQHMQLMKERFYLYVSKLAASDPKKNEITETDI